MRTWACAAAAAVLFGAGGVCRADKPLPAFSWDTVPRYMHVRKAEAFKPQEIRYLASFPLITFEKTTGVKTFGSTEAGTEKAAAAVKQLNPAAKILYYRNIMVHYPCYAADEALAAIPNGLLADRTGSTQLVRGRVQAFDLSLPAVQQWWLDHAAQVCASENIDGLFVDGNIKALEPGYLRRPLGDEKRDAVTKGYHTVMQRLPDALGRSELVIANVIRARFKEAGLEYMDYFDGSYIEGFEHAVGRASRPDYVVKGIGAFQTAARAGKIIAFTIGQGGYADTDMDAGPASGPAVEDQAFQERFTYALALFLVCAEEHSYFMFSDGYAAQTSRLWMKELPEYERPLGPPKGPAVKNGYVYKRSFEYADVTVDVEAETGRIVWKAPAGRRGATGEQLR